MQYNPIVVFDFETSSADRHNCEILQIGALVINPRNLKPFKGEEFEVLMKPLDWNGLREKALTKNRLTREQLRADGLEPAEGWHQFTEFVKRFNRNNRSDSYNAPIAAGYNIHGFDLVIAERYCKEYGPGKVDKEGVWKPTLFNGYMDYDVMRMLGSWTENLSEPAKLGMDFIRKFMGFPQASKDMAHNALQDVKDTAALLIKLLEFQRTLSPHIKFKDCFSPDSEPMSDQAIKAKKAAAKAREAQSYQSRS